MSSFGLGKKKKGGKVDERTPEEKEAALKEFYARSFKSASTGVYGNDTWLNTWEIDINKYQFFVEGDNNQLVGRINIGTDEKPTWVGENFVYPPGYGNLGENMAGVGTRFKDSAEEPASYHKSFILVLGMPLPQDFVDNCTRNGIDVYDRVEKTREFLRKRTERFVQAVVDNPKAYGAFRLECYNDAKKKLKNVPTDSPEFLAEFKYLINKDLNLQTEEESFTVDGKEQTVTTVKVKASTYSTTMATPDHVEKELAILAKSPVAETKEIVAHIEKARAAGYGFCDPIWTDEIGKRIYGSILSRKFNVGDVVILRCRNFSYSKGINRGVSPYIVEGRTMHRNIAIGNSVMVTDEYKKQDPRKPMEILVLKTVKNNTTAAPTEKGVALVDLSTLLVKSKKMDQSVLTAALAILIEAGLLVGDDTHVKLVRHGLDVDSIPVQEPSPDADPAAPVMNMMDGGVGDKRAVADSAGNDNKKQKMSG